MCELMVEILIFEYLLCLVNGKLLFNTEFNLFNYHNNTINLKGMENATNTSTNTHTDTHIHRKMEPNRLLFPLPPSTHLPPPIFKNFHKS